MSPALVLRYQTRLHVFHDCDRPREQITAGLTTHNRSFLGDLRDLLDKYTKYEISEALRPDLSFVMVLTLAMGGRLFRNVNCVISGVALRFVGGEKG